MQCILLLIFLCAAASAQDAWRAKCDVQISEKKEGSFIVEVHPQWAKLGAERFREIVKNNVYDGTKIFRVVPGFVAQWGIPGDADAAAAWKENRIKDDPHKAEYSNLRSYITFAKAGPGTRTSQVFINLADNKGLDPMGFPPFGKVVEGMEVVDAFNSEHGQKPNQGSIQREGNAYLDRQYPGLSYIKTCTILDWAEPVDRDDEL